MEHVLVTGGAGYVGSGLLRELLSQGYYVTCVDKLMFGGESLLDIWHNDNFTFIKCDINDWDKFKGVFTTNTFDAVIHLAGLKSVSESNSLAIDYYGLQSEAKLSDLIRCVRADEERHAIANAGFAGEQSPDIELESDWSAHDEPAVSRNG